MPRIAGIFIPDNKRIEVALTYVFGIGETKAKKILSQTKIDSNMRANKLTPEELNELKGIIEKSHRVEGDLRRDIMLNIKRLKDIKSYKGIRHMKRLPVRGQRTKTNCRTVRGNKRVTVGSGKAKTDKK